MAQYTSYSSDSTESSIDVEKPIKSRASTVAQCMPGSTSLADKLRLAASHGQSDRVKQLISCGACLDFDSDGRTALHYASANGFVDCVQLLITSEAINACDKMGYTAVHQAAAHGHLEVVNLLASFACFLDTQDVVHGNTPLHDTAWYGFSRTVQFLVQSGANVQQLNKANFSALHLAAQNGHNQTARFLLYAGCSAEHKNNYGDTALHTAARYGHAGITRILIGARCNVNECNKNLDTALHIAAALKRHKIAKLLVEAGINVALKNKQGERALDVAVRKQYVELINLLTPRAHVSARVHSASFESVDSRLKSSEASVDGEEIDGIKKKKKKKKLFFFKKKPKDKDKSSDTESHSSAPSQDLTHCRPSAEELVLGFQLHRMQQQRRSQYSDGFNALNCDQRLNIQNFLENRASNYVVQKNQTSLFKAPLPPQFNRHSGAVSSQVALGRLHDDDLRVLERQFRNQLHVTGTNTQIRGSCRAPGGGQVNVNPVASCQSRQIVDMGNRLYRSKSDETLSNFSFQLDERAQAALTLKRKNGINTKHIPKDFVYDTDDLLEEDRASCRIPEGRSASGSAGPFVEECERGSAPETPAMTIPASVMEWFARNENEGAAVRSSYRVKTSKHRPAAVHDL